MVMFTLFLLLISATFAHAQQSPCETQLGQALGRQGTTLTVAKEDREAVVAYFQTEIRKKVQEIETLQKQIEEQNRRKEEKN